MRDVLQKEKKKEMFNELKNIETFEDKEFLDQPDEMEQILNVNKKAAADEDDNALLSLLVQDKIDSFKSKIPKMEKKFKKI